MTVVGCWAHLRRKFDEALKVLPPEARENSLALVGKGDCDQLFEYERDFADLPPEKRQEKRMKTSKPKMEAFFAWADSCNAIPKSLVGKAVYYAQSQRKYLERYLLDGRLEISNNRAERSIKPFVIGRKNWLFANTSNGAKASAILYSLIETAKENGLDSYKYFLLFQSLPNSPQERWEFDLDYSGYVLKHFPGFEAEMPRLAAKFARTIDRTYESCAWMDDKAFALTLSDALDVYFGTSKLPDFY